MHDSRVFKSIMDFGLSSYRGAQRWVGAAGKVGSFWFFQFLVLDFDGWMTRRENATERCGNTRDDEHVDIDVGRITKRSATV